MAKKTAIIVLACLLAISVVACVILGVKLSNSAPNEQQIECIDGCDIPRYDEDGNEVFAAVSPVGYCNVEMIEQAPRLDTLSGKTIALVGGSFMASVTHFELKRCIEEKYSDVNILIFNRELGTAGNFATPTNKGDKEDNKNDSNKTKTQVQKFQTKLKELGVDAVIGGNGGCGICTMKESGSAIAAEYVGIPAVMVAAPTFVDEVHSIGASRGVPVLRAATYPGAFATLTEAQLRENTRFKVWPEVEKMLTTPITQKEIDELANDKERPYDEVIYYGNNDEVQDYYKTSGWTDGLPIGIPTPEKVKEYLKFTPYAEDKVFGKNEMILQANRKNYVYTVAVNAVMSGVPAEFMPLCIAFVECMDYGDWYRTLISSHQWSPYAWINGPVARQLGIDFGQGAISEETNKALGRFIELAMLNIGGYYVKENRAGTFGYITPFTFAEDEESCIAAGWDPYHVTQGFDRDSSTVTAASALSWGENVATSTDKAEKIMQTMAFDITEKQENGLGTIDSHVYRTVLMTKDVAMTLKELYTSKEMLEDVLIETARRPVIERAYALYYANTGSQQDRGDMTFEKFYNQVLQDLEKNADAKLTATPEWLKGSGIPDEIWTFATMKKGETPLIVTGDTSRNKFQVMPGGGYATVEIHLPDNWDELLAPLGYEPLSHFYLEDKNAAQDINVPEGLPDGNYIITATAPTREGRLYFKDTTIQIFENGAAKSIELDRMGTDRALAVLLGTLKNPCSIVVEGGKIVEVVLRPASAGQSSTTTDLSALKYINFGTAKISFEVNHSSSSGGTSATRSGTTVIISATIEEMKLSLGGEITADGANSAGFITCADGKLTINTKATTGSVCKFSTVIGDNTCTVTFTMKPNNQIEITYEKVN